MKQLLNQLSLSVLAFSLMISHVWGQQKQAIESVQTVQTEVKVSTGEFVESLKPIFAELGELGAAEADLVLVRETLGELTQLSDAEMVAILAALDTALNHPGTAEADGNLETALAGQSKVVEGLRGIFERLRDRQLELTVASKAEALRRRQAENQHRTEMLKNDQGDAVVAQAEQRALEESVNELVRELEAIQESAEQEGTGDSEVDEEKLDRMKELAQQATEQLENEAYAEAAQTQKEIGEMLADLAAETGLEQNSEAFLEDLVRQLHRLLARQTSLLSAGESGSPEEQENLAIATESLRIPTENVNAPAGFQLAGAAKAMRRAFVAMSAQPVVSPINEQGVAIQSLKRAIELLEANLEKMKEGNGEGDELAELAEMYRQAENLQRRQNQQNEDGGSPSNQAQIARDTAALQEDAQGQSPEAARELGRAAARMAEALDADLDEAEREWKLEEAAEQLASATESILKEGRAQRNQPPGQGSGGQSMETVVLDDEILGPSELSPSEREAIESARREPVSQEYAPMVEAYYDKLSRQSGREE